jgi:TATA-box binding protein (TBP) (component of TFIID and TFIIIB)
MSDSVEFTPLRISTLVTTGHLGTTINLSGLFNQIKSQIIPIGYPQEGFLKMEHEDKVIGYSSRDLLTKRHVSDKTFFNQSTIVLRKLQNTGEFKEVNIKLFANGGFQMTGVPDEEFSRDAIKWLIKVMNEFSVSITQVPLELKKFTVQLLNSDYKVNTLIKRAELHRILCTKYHLSSTFETTIYQGVNTKYYYNDKTSEKNGLCKCDKFCSGQGDGSDIGLCKRITIAIFQTGSIIITGARTQKQLDEAYVFINTIIKKHFNEVTRRV